MASKTRMLNLIKDLDWKAVRDDLTEDPKLLEFRDERGRNWLHLACMVKPETRKLKPTDQIKLVRALLDSGLDIDDAAFTEGVSWKATPVWHAVARSKSPALVKFLLEQGADPNYSLFAAADGAMIRLLVKNGAVVDEDSFEHETPFLGCIQWSWFDNAEELLKLGADVDTVDKRGRTALHLMLKKGSDKKHFRTILKYGPRGDIADVDGKTVIDIMSRKRDPDFKKMARQLSG